jgi:hypothetical protein
VTPAVLLALMVPIWLALLALLWWVAGQVEEIDRSG